MVTPPNPNQPLVIQNVDPAINNFPDPAFALYEIVKGDWGKGDPNFKYRYARVRFITQASYWDGGETPAVVFQWVNDDIGRMGVGSAKRYHHYSVRITVFSRDVNERWQIVLEIQRVLQKFAVNPRQDIKRIDFYKWTPFQAPSPAQVLFTARTDCVMIYVE
jgi:hypothetical protein